MTALAVICILPFCLMSVRLFMLVFSLFLVSFSDALLFYVLLLVCS